MPSVASSRAICPPAGLPLRPLERPHTWQLAPREREQARAVSCMTLPWKSHAIPSVFISALESTLGSVPHWRGGESDSTRQGHC